MNYLSMKLNIIFLPLISALFLIIASCKQKYSTASGEIWATSYHIVYSGSNLDDSIRAELVAIDNELSMFNPHSEISAINDCLTDSVGRRFAEVFDVCRCIWLVSGGVYDPTIAPVAELWGFGRSDSANPSDSAIAAAIEAVGLGYCDIADNRIVKKSPATRFDFSSVAKGYGIDCVADMFDRNGVDNYMIEIGGEIAVRGVNPWGLPWHIQIDSPTGGMGHSQLQIISMGPGREAMASSGNYRNVRRDSTGYIYGHTLSPFTGRPVMSRLAAVSIRSPRCADADALATACMASGDPDSALAFASRAHAAALIVVIDNDSLTTTQSNNW